MSAQPAWFHRLDEILVSTTENVDSIGFVVASIRRSQPCNGSRCTVSVSSRPSSSERAADGFNSCNSPCNVSGFHECGRAAFGKPRSVARRERARQGLNPPGRAENPRPGVSRPSRGPLSQPSW